MADDLSRQRGHRGRIRAALLGVFSRDIFLILLPTVALALGVFWAAIVPLWQSPDEPAHYGYVQSLAESDSLIPDHGLSRELGLAYELSGLDALPFDPRARQPFIPGSTWGPAEQEVLSIPHALRGEIKPHSYNPATSYPPGYYVLASVVYRALASHDILTIMFGLRVFSAVVTSITVLVSYLTLRRFFRDRALARAATFVIALSPMYIYMGMAVNVDVLVWLLFSILLFLLTKSLQDGLSWQLNLAMASIVGVGLWVKQTFLIGVIFYALLLVFLARRREVSFAKSVRYLLAFLGVVLLFDGWLYFSGLISTSPGTPSRGISVSGFLGHFLESWRTYRWALQETFWGSFGWLDAPLSRTLYSTVGFVSLAGLVGFGFYLRMTARKGQPRAMATFFLLLIGIFLMALSFVNYTVIESGAGWFLQGRYLFPIMGPIIAVLVTGLTWFASERMRKGIMIGLISAMVIFHTLAVFNHVVPRYYA